MLRSQVMATSGSWTFGPSTGNGNADLHFPIGANAGTVTVGTSASPCTPGADGTSFVVKADGVTILTTGCIVNSGQSVAVPPGTANIEVIITNNCLGGGRNPATWVVSGVG